MRILLLPSYFHPEHAASSYLGDHIRKSLADNDVEMLLYTPMPSRGISKETRFLYKNRKYEEFYDGKLKVYRFPMLAEGSNPIIRAVRYMACNFIQFYKGITAKDIDMIFVASTPPTQGAMAALIKKTRKIPFVYNLQDIFPDSLITTGLTRKGSLIWRLGRIIERFTYANADKIIVISAGFKRNIIEKGVPSGKIEIVYNWVDESAIIDIRRENNRLFDTYGLSRSDFIVSYCGNIGLTQNLEMLLSVANELKHVSDIRFVILGDGAAKEHIKAMAERERVSNVIFLPFQPYKDIASVFSLGDVGLVISKENVGNSCVPSKTWSIMSASRPVLANFDDNSELQRIIEDNRVGLFTKAGDKDALKQAILHLYRNRDTCKALGQNGRSYILENLTRAVGTGHYLRIFKSVCPERCGWGTT